MIPLSWDTETALIRPALLAPPMVCQTWQMPGDVARIAHHTEAESLLHGWLLNPEILFVGAHIAYDFAVICERFPDLRPLVFAAYDADRVTDIQIRQKLLDIASGCYRGRFVGKGVWLQYDYSLEAVAKRCAGMTLTKDAWRYSYGHFIDIPLDRWVEHARTVQANARARLEELRALRPTLPDPEDVDDEIESLASMVNSDPTRCTEYPLDDARAGLAVFLAQEKHRSFLDDQFRQARAAFALYLSSTWGLRTDKQGVEILRAETQERLEEIQEELCELGIVRADGSKDTKAAKRRMIEICARDGIKLRRTKTHGDAGKCKKLDGTKLPDGADECEDHVCLDADACASAGDPILAEYAEFSTLRKVLSNDVKALAAGIHWPIHTRYDIAETGRTTSSKPNIQNWTRARKCRECNGKGEVPGAPV